MRKIVIGILSRVSGNVNANEVDGDRIRIKKLISATGEVYPFVSARAIKRGIREKLKEYGYSIDPFTTQEGNKLADSGDPIKYVDNDIFGYLYIKNKKQVSRISPIFMSPLIALTHTPIKTDFGGRFPQKPGENNPTPFEIEVADFVGLLKVVITERCGQFDENEKTDNEKNWEEYVKEDKLLKNESSIYTLPEDERKKRIMDFLKILLIDGWAYPRRANNFTMAEHKAAIIYAGEKLYPIWKYVKEDNSFDVSKFSKDENNKYIKAYIYPDNEVTLKEIKDLSNWLVRGKWTEQD